MQVFLTKREDWNTQNTARPLAVLNEQFKFPSTNLSKPKHCFAMKPQKYFMEQRTQPDYWRNPLLLSSSWELSGAKILTSFWEMI